MPSLNSDVAPLISIAQNVLSSSSTSCDFTANADTPPTAAEVEKLASLIDQTKEAAMEMVAKNNPSTAAATVAVPPSHPPLPGNESSQENLSASISADIAASSSSSTSFRAPIPPSPTAATPPPTPSAPIFFKSFVFSPPLPIRIDYHGRRVDMQQGPLIGLLIGLTHLTESQVTLKRLAFR